MRDAARIFVGPVVSAKACKYVSTLTPSSDSHLMACFFVKVWVGGVPWVLAAILALFVTHGHQEVNPLESLESAFGLR